MDPRVIVALDFANSKTALEFVARINSDVCKLKIGKELFTAAGPQLVEKLVNKGFDVFLDLKFHDIPNTVKKAVLSAAQLGVWMLNVHALGGRPMMLAAKEGIELSSHKAILIAVTVLTSSSANDLAEIGIPLSPAQMVDKLAVLALDAGMDGLVCSAQEVAQLRQKFGQSPLLVTPGIRPSGAANDDQHRIMTPVDAIKQGSSYLVMGRPVIQHAEPMLILQDINQQINTLIHT